MTEYRTHTTHGGWLKKLDILDVHGLISDSFEGWDLDPAERHPTPYTVMVTKVWENDVDWQREMWYWADDNCEGYFFQHSLRTEGGTPIVNAGDVVTITLAFQRKEDAFAFKMKWA